jgi:hypothetical protein
MKREFYGGIDDYNIGRINGYLHQLKGAAD